MCASDARTPTRARPHPPLQPMTGRGPDRPAALQAQRGAPCGTKDAPGPARGPQRVPHRPAHHKQVCPCVWGRRWGAALLSWSLCANARGQLDTWLPVLVRVAGVCALALCLLTRPCLAPAASALQVPALPRHGRGGVPHVLWHGRAANTAAAVTDRADNCQLSECSRRGAATDSGCSAGRR
jgi:hypothetical protein